MAGTGRKVWVADEVLSAADLQSYIQDQVVFVYNDATARASGILSPTEGMISYLKSTDAVEVYNGSSWVNTLPDVGTPGTYTKVVTDSKGRVTSATTLVASDIPSLDAGKITSGTFTSSQIPSLDASKITSGTLGVGVSTGSNITGGNLYATNKASISGSNGDVYSLGSGVFQQGVNGGTGLAAIGIYSTSNSGPAVYVNSSGVLGVGGSSERFKENIVDAKLKVDAVRKLRVRNFTYKPEFDENDAVQVGVIAEELVKLGLSEFVYFGDDGLPMGVHYEKLALLAIAGLQFEADRVDELAVRVAKLESK